MKTTIEEVKLEISKDFVKWDNNNFLFVRKTAYSGLWYTEELSVDAEKIEVLYIESLNTYALFINDINAAIYYRDSYDEMMKIYKLVCNKIVSLMLE